MNDNNLNLTSEEINLLNNIVEEAHPIDNNPNNSGISLIPENSSTANLDITTVRFSSAIWFENIKSKTIILGGAGGIGSFVTLLLSRVKPKSIYIYDNDIVELVNMGGQLYSINDIGISKVQIAKKIAENYSCYMSMFAINEKYTENDEACDIMICGFDNMNARRVFFNNWLNHVNNKNEDKNKCLFIDGRLAAEDFQVICIQGNDSFNIERYQKEFLFNDTDAETTLCSYKQTSYCANMIASYMVNLFINFCANEVGAFRSIPFFTSYSAETMYLKTEE